MLNFLLDTCTCSTPSAGTSGNNEMKCSNGETRFCEDNEECYATESFDYGQLDIACRTPGNYIESKCIFSAKYLKYICEKIIFCLLK